MSYIQIEIGGKLRGLKFNQLAMSTFLKFVDLSAYNETANYAMVYGGLIGNNYVKREENDFTFEDVCDWVEEITPEKMVEIDKVMSEAVAYQKLIESAKKEEKPTKKKLKKASVSI